MAATVARSSVSAGGPRNTNLPVIQHPMARMGSLLDIEVKGESTKTPAMGGLGERAKTLLALSQEAQSFPALSERLSSRGSTQISFYRDPDIYGTRTPADKGKFRTSAHLQPKYSTEELVMMIKERLATGQHAMRHLFQAHDFGGEGRVSRQALQRILHSLVGYVGSEQFNRLIRQLGLDKQPTVSCDEFIACFADNGNRKSRDWMSAVQKKEIQENPEEHLRNRELRSGCQFVTAPYCLAVLRETFRKNTNGAGIMSVLPASCCGVDGRVHSLHLLEVIEKCGLTIDEVELGKLWSRFDPTAAGAIRLSQFLKVLGLDETGQPRPFTTPRYVLVSKDDDKVVKSVKGPSATTTSRDEGCDKTISLPPIKEKEAKVQQSARDEEVSETKEVAEEKPKSSPKLKRKPSKLTKPKAPKLDKIVDCLFYKFEENYNEIIEGFKVLDFLSDGFISRIDFKLVLEEFGLKCQSTDLEHFLAKCGIRGIRGQVNYREFLNKFWNKTESGIVHRIITSKSHVFARADHFNPDTRTDETKKVELLESKMVEFFHKDFLTLLGAMRKCDKYNIGVVTQYEFKEGIERLLGYSMTDSQWAELKEDVGLDADGLVPYPKFLERFSAPPGQWNKREVGEFMVRQVTSNTMAPAVERIKVYSAKYTEERESMKSANEEKTRLDIIKDAIEKRENGIFDEVTPSTLTRTATGGEGEAERAGAEEMASMMSKMLDKPLVNKVSEMDAGSPPEPFTPENQMPSILQSGPDKMATPRGPRQVIGHDHQEKSLDELNDLVCVLVRYRFHRLDKAFKAIDRKMTGRFYKGQFNEMLQQCDIYLSPSELTRLWTTFPLSADGMFNFSTLVRHFTDFKRTTHAAPPQPVIRERTFVESESRSPVEQPRHKPNERKLSRLQKIKVPVLGRQRTLLVQRDELTDRIKPQVLGQWNELKNIFRQADQMGTATIPTCEMKDILKRLQLNISEEDTATLLNKFDLKNNGNFHYIEFLKVYTEKSSKDQVKKNVYSSVNYKLEKRLVKEWKNIKRAFRRHDSEGKGYLNVSDFKEVLRSCGIPVTDEDLYHILSEFDTMMNGKVSYEEFLGTLMTHV